MNIVEDNTRETLCIIKETGEEKILIPVYDSDDKTNLTVMDNIIGLGKFYGWKDPEIDKIYIKGTEASPKPQEPYELFGVECGDGWKDIIKPLFEWIEKYNNENPNNVIEIQQVRKNLEVLDFMLIMNQMNLRN